MPKREQFKIYYAFFKDIFTATYMNWLVAALHDLYKCFIVYISTPAFVLQDLLYLTITLALEFYKTLLINKLQKKN